MSLIGEDVIMQKSSVNKVILVGILAINQRVDILHPGPLRQVFHLLPMNPGLILKIKSRKERNGIISLLGINWQILQLHIYKRDNWYI